MNEHTFNMEWEFGVMPWEAKELQVRAVVTKFFGAGVHQGMTVDVFLIGNFLGFTQKLSTKVCGPSEWYKSTACRIEVTADLLPF